jgi:hypothetical protein
MLVLTWSVVEIQGSWSLVFLQGFLVGLAGAALGLMFGSLFDHEREAVFGVVCIFVMCLVMSGVSTVEEIVHICERFCNELVFS